MAEIRKILCPTDFSEASRRALDYALPLAERLGAEVYFLHVVPVIPQLEPTTNYHFDVPEYQRLLENDSRRELAKLVAAAGPAVPRHEILRHGEAASEIMKAADELDADVIVISTAGRSGIDRLVFGSVTEKVVRRARCPVLTVPPPRGPS